MATVRLLRKMQPFIIEGADGEEVMRFNIDVGDRNVFRVHDELQKRSVQVNELGVKLIKGGSEEDIARAYAMFREIIELTLGVEAFEEISDYVNDGEIDDGDTAILLAPIVTEIAAVYEGLAAKKDAAAKAKYAGIVNDSEIL